MQFKDYYKTLGVEPTVSDAEIKSAYRRLARKYHPDVSKEAGAEDKFKAVNEAYEVLKDHGKRNAYDQLKAGGYRGGEDFRPPPGWGDQGGFEYNVGGGGFSDFFESLFGGQRARPGRGAPPPPPKTERRAKLELDLEIVFSGGKQRIEVDGRTLEVKIPAGVQSGQQIRLASQGGQGRDLLLEVVYRPHPKFEVDGQTITHRLAVMPWQAALGEPSVCRRWRGRLTCGFHRTATPASDYVCASAVCLQPAAVASRAIRSSSLKYTSRRQRANASERFIAKWRPLSRAAHGALTGVRGAGRLTDSGHHW